MSSSTAESFTVLCTGDIHVGRTSSALPEDMNLNPADFRAATAWEALVDYAREERVRFVLLTGDVADESNKYFEAFGALKRGFNRLREKGIVVAAVSGNHDFDVFPRLVDDLGADDFVLLGRDGTWESRDLPLVGAPALRLHGWSFPARHTRVSPMDSYGLEAPPPGLPAIGLVHGDLGASKSDYAPLRLEDLQRAPVSGWVLGHLHRPDLKTTHAGPWVLYPGSPQALHPNETGAHGPWMFRVENGSVSEPWHVPLSAVRYENMEVSLDGVESMEDAESRITRVLGEVPKDVETTRGLLKLLVARLTLVGRTPLHSRLPGSVARFEEASNNHNGVEVRVDRVVPRTSPHRDISALANSDGLPGEIARLVRRLEGVDHAAGKVEGLIQDAARAADGARNLRQFACLDHERNHDDDTPEEDRLRKTLTRHATRILDALLQQRERTP